MSVLKIFIALCLLTVFAISSETNEDMTEAQVKAIIENKFGPLFSNTATKSSKGDDFEITFEVWLGKDCSGSSLYTATYHNHDGLECEEPNKIKIKDQFNSNVPQDMHTIENEKCKNINSIASVKATWKGWCYLPLPIWAIVLINIVFWGGCCVCCYFCCCRKKRNKRAPHHYPQKHHHPQHHQQQAYNPYPQQQYNPNPQQYNPNPQVQVVPMKTPYEQKKVNV